MAGKELIPRNNGAVLNISQIIRAVMSSAAEAECQRCIEADIPLAAYDQAIEASHLFNLLDARGVISVTERQAYIGRVRALAKQCADAFVQTEAGGYAA